MSITSSNNHELRPDFARLLAQYPALAAWLFNALPDGIEVQAEKLLPGFLAECSEQGIPEDAYPFSARDRGLADLQAYIQKAEEELQAFRTPGQSREQAHGDPNHQNTPAEELPTHKLASTDSHANKDQHETIQEANDPEDNAHLATAHIPASPLKEQTPVQNEGEFSSQDQEQDTHHASGDLSLAPEGSSSPLPSTPVSDGLVPGALSENQPESADGNAQNSSEQAPVATSVAGQMASASEEEQEQTAQVAPPGRRPSAPLRRGKRSRRPRTRRERIVSWVLLSVVLLAILIPASFLVGFGISAYTTYRSLSGQAHSAVNHLLDIKTTFSSGAAGGSHLNGILNSSRLQRAEQDFVASGRDFQQLQKQLKQSSTLQTVTTYFPRYRSALVSAQAASQIGIDVAAIGQIATSHAAQIAPTFSGSLLSATGKPLITQPLLNTLNMTIDQVTPLLEDVQAQAQNVSLDALPISETQRTQVGQLFQLLPQVISDIGITRSLLNQAGWLLGVNQPRTFLVQTMDRAELRGAGGFTGQYGELTVNGGRIAPFSLKDISLVEYTDTSVTQGQLAPPQYRSWWPFANWGLRDSNISADFPTTAQLAINLYKQETGDTVDGVISFTPIVIEHVLAVVGPIQVPGYDTTVTAQNLEDILHYYQLDNSGIYKQILKQPGDNSTSQRKRFTSLVTTLLMNKVRSASANELLGIAHQILADLKSKDLQMYFTDPATENVLVKYGYAGLLDRSTTHDGEFVVQQNLSASKASQFVQTIEHDTVTLDSGGGATHVLQIRLVYNQAGPVYGYDTYYDYLRVYVPPSSKLLSGDGFSSGTPLCGGLYGSCPIDGPYPAGELSCPSGQYQPGAEPPTLTVPDGGTWQPLQTLGGPTNTDSDEPGRAMYAGWVIVPKNCTMNVTLSWYVPPMSGHPYSLLVQRQAGTFPELDLSILPDAADCAKLGTTGLHVDTTLTKDISFSLPTYHASSKASGQSCYPRPGV
jgi:hypothetical protein